jgi:hypothetical protein
MKKMEVRLISKKSNKQLFKALSNNQNTFSQVNDSLLPSTKWKLNIQTHGKASAFEEPLQINIFVMNTGHEQGPTKLSFSLNKQENLPIYERCNWFLITSFNLYCRNNRQTYTTCIDWCSSQKENKLGWLDWSTRNDSDFHHNDHWVKLEANWELHKNSLYMEQSMRVYSIQRPQTGS